MSRELSISVERRPYLLQPERPAEGEIRALRQGETETEVAPVWQEKAREVGLPMRRPNITPSTILAHQGTLYAKDKGLDDEFHHAAVKAYWETGANLGDMEVLKDIADASGLDWAELSPLLESGHYRPAVFQEYQAAKDLGVGGTPTYRIAGGEIAFGDLSFEDLRGAILGAKSA